MSADLLRRAADRLEDPALCNTNPWDKPLAALLRGVAHDGEQLHDVLREVEGPEHPGVNWQYGGLGQALAVARAVLGDDQ